MRRIGFALKMAVAGWLLGGLIAPHAMPGQEFREPKSRKRKPEKPDKPLRFDKPDRTDKLEKIANALAKKEEKILYATAKQTIGAETERDRWIKVMAEVHPGITVPDARGDIDYSRWFDAVGQGQSTWTPQGIREKSIKELYLRAAQRLAIDKGQPISREAFLAYAVQNLSFGQSPPWKTPKPEVDPFDSIAKLFNGMDRDKSGALEYGELTETLRAVVGHYDANGNGALEYDEYREYFRARMNGYRENPAALAAGPPEPRRNSQVEAPKPPDASKPAPSVPMPKWYRELDEDHDGQVGLYEWRTAGQRPLGEFATVDRDGDGLLTPFEIKQLLQTEPRSPYLKADLPSIPSQFLVRSPR